MRPDSPLAAEPSRLAAGLETGAGVGGTIYGDAGAKGTATGCRRAGVRRPSADDGGQAMRRTRPGPTAAVLAGALLGLAVLAAACAPQREPTAIPTPPAERIDDAPACARRVDDRLVDAPCPTPGS